MTKKFIDFIIFSLLLFSSLAFAEAHPHQGKLPIYKGEPPAIVLTEKEIKRLKKFKPVYKKQVFNGKQRGIAIFRVKASVKTIWSVIHHFSDYPQWIPELKTTNVYQQDGNHTYVHFVASHWLLGKTQWYVNHNFPKLDELDQRNWGSWILDYQHRSDFDDSVGFWQVKPVANNPDISEVIYSVDLRLGNNSPIFFRNAAIKKGLKTATKWLKQESEAAQILLYSH